MAGVAVVTDTTHYLPAELVRRLGVHEVSLHVHWSGRQDREADMPDFAAFYRSMQEGGDQLPTTSQPSVGEFLAVYEPLLEAGHDIVSVHLAGNLSGTVRSAEQARERLEADGTAAAGRIRVIDSETACGALGLVVMAAAAAARAGEDAAGVEERIREARANLGMWFSLETLEYLRRGGRIGGAQAWVGTTLKIKPILTVAAEITPVERVRTSRRAFERLVEYLSSLREQGADGWVVQHIRAAEKAEQLTERGREIFGTEPLFVSEIGPVIGAHVGPGLTGVGGVPRRLVE